MCQKKVTYGKRSRLVGSGEYRFGDRAEVEDHTPPNPSGGKNVECSTHEAALEEVPSVSETYVHVLRAVDFRQEILEKHAENFCGKDATKFPGHRDLVENIDGYKPKSQ